MERARPARRSPRPSLGLVEIAMNAVKPLALIALLAVGVAGCDDKKAENNTPTKADSSKMEPQTDQSAPPSQRPKP